MKTSAFFTLSSLLALAAAAPLKAKREVFVSTIVAEVIETVVMTTTVWVEPGQAVPTSTANAGLPQAPPVAPVVPTTTSVSILATAPLPIIAHQQPTSIVSSPVTTSTSAAIAPSTPAPSPSSPVAQKPSSAPAAAPASAPPSTPSPDTSGSSNKYPVVTQPGAAVADGPATSAKPFKGSATYYNIGAGGTGSCGGTLDESMMIVAVSKDMMGTPINPNNNPLCGREISITSPKGKTVTAKVADTCPGCATNPYIISTAGYNLDLTPSVFNALGGGDGRIDGITWYWI